MEIKIVTEADIKIVQSLAETIWPLCYGNIISADQIRYMLDMMYSADAIELQLKKGHVFILATDHNIPVGFVSYSQKSLEKPTIFRLHKLYVLTTLHTQGIGSFLLDWVCKESKISAANLLELNVNKQNPAIVFYNKKGFTVLKEEIINIGAGYVMDDYVMAKKLAF